jgi:hypothetical protein
MNILPVLHTGTLIVVCAPHAAREPVSALAAELALRGPATVLDAGNRFQPYLVARILRQHTTDVNNAAKHLFIRRAFTCYQVLALLEGTPAVRQPYLVLDLLSSFYDEHVRAPEASRLLDACLYELERLCRQAPVLVTLAPPLVAERAFLLERVCARAGRVLVDTIPVPQTCQPALFPA